MAVHRISQLLVALAIAIAALPLLSATAQDPADEVWEADFFPITVTYNGDLWGNRSTSSFEGNERFQVVARATVFTPQALETDIEEADCLDVYIESISSIAGVADLDEVTDRALPAAIRGADVALVGYDFLWPGREDSVPMLQYLSCQAIGEGSLLLIGIETREGIYDEELEIIDAILAGVEISD